MKEAGGNKIHHMKEMKKKMRVDFSPDLCITENGGVGICKVLNKQTNPYLSRNLYLAKMFQTWKQTLKKRNISWEKSLSSRLENILKELLQVRRKMREKTVDP